MKDHVPCRHVHRVDPIEQIEIIIEPPAPARGDGRLGILLFVVGLLGLLAVLFR